MKLTREQVWQEAVKYASENSDDGIVSLMVGFHARMNAACEVEEVDPVVEEAMRWFARPETGSIPKRFDDMVRSLAAFHRHMLAKHRPAFDEGRAREIVLRLSQSNRMLGSSKASSDFFEMLAREAIKEYTCGSSGSSCGRGAGSSGTGSSPDALTPQPRESKQSSGTSAPAADAWCRWETVDQFCGRMTKEHPSGGSIGQLVVARDTGWTKRFTEGDLSVRAWQDATRPMGELAPSYGVWLKDRLTQ